MAQQDNFPFISIVVISRNRHELLEKAVKSLLMLNYPHDNYEIVIVEEGDEPSPIPQTKYIFLPRKNLGLGYARNQGVKHSKGDIILFTDDDCIVDKCWAFEMAQTIIQYKVGGVAGTTLAQESNLIGKCEEIMGYPGGGLKRYVLSKGKLQPTNWLSGCNCAYDRIIFEKLKFEEKGFGALGADDASLGLLVSENVGCLYNPNAIVYHKPRANFIRIIKWFERRRINEFLFQEKKQGKKDYTVFIRSWQQIVLFRLLVLLMLILGGIQTTIIAVALLFFYIFLLYYRYLAIIHFSKRYLTLLVLPFVKLCMDIGVLRAEIKYLIFPYKALFGAFSEYNR